MCIAQGFVGFYTNILKVRKKCINSIRAVQSGDYKSEICVISSYDLFNFNYMLLLTLNCELESKL